MRKLAPARVSHRGDFLIPRLHDDEVNSYRTLYKLYIREYACATRSSPTGDFEPERNFRSGAATRVNSSRCESPQHDFFR